MTRDMTWHWNLFSHYLTYCIPPQLNALSVVLEGGLEASNGVRVKLDAQYLKEYSFFPGQIIAVEVSYTLVVT